MEKIEFINNVTKMNADTMNQFQDNIENAILNNQEIEEVIQNENDGAIKYKNGLMICYGSVTFSNQNFTSDFWSQFKRSENQRMTATYPVSFVEKPVCNVNLMGNGIFQMIYTEGTETKTPECVAISPNGNNITRDVILKYHAIGKWR